MTVPNFPIFAKFLEDIHLSASLMENWSPERATRIGTGEIALAERVIIKKTPEGCIYLHRWQRSDPDDLHDHPWPSCTLVLAGGFWEVTEAGRFWRDPGYVGFRSALDRHRIEIDLDASGGVQPVSLFLTGPIEREWGFHTSGGFIIGREYRSVAAFRERRSGLVSLDEGLMA
jgi:hypothetical protein